MRFWDEAITGLTLSRSRPYQKNDHRVVEQKNATLVHQSFRTIRLETPEQLKAMNALSEKMWLSSHFFQPVMHFQEKICQGDHVLRHWDRAHTTSERLLATGTLSAEQFTRLPSLSDQTNPMRLRHEISRQLAALWDIPASPASGVSWFCLS